MHMPLAGPCHAGQLKQINGDDIATQDQLGWMSTHNILAHEQLAEDCRTSQVGQFHQGK